MINSVRSIEKIPGQGRGVIVAIKGNQIKQNTRASHAYGLSCANKYGYIFGASCNRFTPGLTVDGYKSRVNIVPVNRAGSERPRGSVATSRKGLHGGLHVPLFTLAKYEKCRGRGRQITCIF